MSIDVDTKLVYETVQDLELVVAGDDFDLDVGLVCYSMLEETNRVLARVRSELACRMAEEMGEKRHTVEGVGTFERHRKTDRKRWDSDALLRSVLDTRMVNTDTGEVKDETPLDKVLAVWNLGVPRTTVLKVRGIDGDEFCTTEPAPWSIQLTANAPISAEEAAA